MACHAVFDRSTSAYLQGYVIYSVLEGMAFLLSQVPGPVHTVEDVPTGVTLQYQVAALDSSGREGLPSGIVQVAGIL